METREGRAMPFVNIQIVKGQAPAKKDEIARRVAATINEVTGIPKDAVWVVFEDVDAADWYVGDNSVEKLRKAKS
jgi:4-oxalocrotonate tautomerase